jgi:hypothetical protein
MGRRVSFIVLMVTLIFTVTFTGCGSDSSGPSDEMVELRVKENPKPCKIWGNRDVKSVDIIDRKDPIGNGGSQVYPITVREYKDCKDSWSGDTNPQTQTYTANFQKDESGNWSITN